MKIVGIDPGIFGAIAKIDPENHTIEVYKMPFHKIQPGEKIKKLVDPVKVGKILNYSDILRAYVEEVHAMPGEGVVSVFGFGRSFGVVLGALGALQIPTSPVSPGLWKKVLKVPAEKDAARYRASQLFPACAEAWSNKNQDGLAEAVLIAFYGMCELNYPVRKKFTLITDASLQD